jgi:hypothetical protein
MAKMAIFCISQIVSVSLADTKDRLPANTTNLFYSSVAPTYMLHMYPYERHMVVLKGYVRNHAHPEGSMIEGYN